MNVYYTKNARHMHTYTPRKRVEVRRKGKEERRSAEGGGEGENRAAVS